MSFKYIFATTSSLCIFLVAEILPTTLISIAKPWRQWRGRLPHKIGCVNGTLAWRQTLARMITPEQWSDFQTTAEVHLTLTRPDHSTIKEKGVARNTGVMSSVTGSRISAGVGTQSISLKLDSKILCESWKFDEPTPGFFSGLNK